MIIHISNLTSETFSGRMENSDGVHIGKISVKPGYYQINDNHGTPALRLFWLFLDNVGDWFFADYAGAKEFHISIVSLPEGGFRHLSVETQ